MCESGGSEGGSCGEVVVVKTTGQGQGAEHAPPKVRSPPKLLPFRQQSPLLDLPRIVHPSVYVLALEDGKFYVGLATHGCECRIGENYTLHAS